MSELNSHPSVEETAALYEQLDLRWTTGIYLGQRSGGVIDCACAAGVCFRAKNHEAETVITYPDDYDVCAVLNWTSAFVLGVASGNDGCELRVKRTLSESDEEYEDYVAGYAYGREVRERMIWQKAPDGWE